MFARVAQMELRGLISPLASRGFVNQNRHASSAPSGDETKVVLADEGRTLVCWHPEPEFPYEQSMPIPEIQAKVQNVIKPMDNVDQFEGLKEEFVREKLMKLTYTAKYRWFPKTLKKKAKKTPMDRPYL